MKNVNSIVSLVPATRQGKRGWGSLCISSITYFIFFLFFFPELQIITSRT